MKDDNNFKIRVSGPLVEIIDVSTVLHSVVAVVYGNENHSANENALLFCSAPTLKSELEQANKEIDRLRGMLTIALPLIHDYSLCGIGDKEYRTGIAKFEQEIKVLLSKNQTE